MKGIYATAILLMVLLVGCNDFGNRKNPLYGIIFRNVKEIPGMKTFESGRGWLLCDLGKIECTKFGISIAINNNDLVVIFDSIVYDNNSQKPKYQILDTVNVCNVNKFSSIVGCVGTKRNGIADAELIELITGGKSKVLNAWRSNRKTGRIELIKDIKGISWVSDIFGE
jgi:hypothetical protein